MCIGTQVAVYPLFKSKKSGMIYGGYYKCRPLYIFGDDRKTLFHWLLSKEKSGDLDKSFDLDISLLTYEALDQEYQEIIIAEWIEYGIYANLSVLEKHIRETVSKDLLNVLYDPEKEQLTMFDQSVDELEKEIEKTKKECADKIKNLERKIRDKMHDESLLEKEGKYKK